MLKYSLSWWDQKHSISINGEIWIIYSIENTNTWSCRYLPFGCFDQDKIIIITNWLLRAWDVRFAQKQQPVGLSVISSQVMLLVRIGHSIIFQRTQVYMPCTFSFCYSSALLIFSITGPVKNVTEFSKLLVMLYVDEKMTYSGRNVWNLFLLLV